MGIDSKRPVGTLWNSIASSVAVLCVFFWAHNSFSVQGLTGIQATYDDQTSTNDDYNTTGGGTADFAAGTTYAIRFNSGANNNLQITGFEVGANTYKYIQLSDAINIERVDNAVTTGRFHIVLYEEVSIVGTNIDLKPSYVATMEASLRSDNVNRGADNVFCNTGDGNGNNNNIERIDYIFSDGYPVHDNISLRGFLVMDRGGNDAFKIAAITNLNSSGKPLRFGPPVSAVPADWGWSSIDINTTVMRGYSEGSDKQHPSANVAVQNLDGVYITWQELGVASNSTIYGYSLAGNDVAAGANWAIVTNNAYFPTNSNADADQGGLDLMSGGAMFFDSTLDCTLGNFVWDDWDGDGVQDANEPGLSNVLIHVYDTRTNLAATIRTLPDGDYLARGLAPDSYFVEFVLPTNYTFSPANVGTNDSIDSDGVTNTGRTTSYTVTAGSSNITVDAGIHLAATDVGVTKSVSNSGPNTNEVITYRVTATNNGPSSAGHIQLTDVLPAEVAFINYGSTLGSYNSTNGIWNIGTLAVGAGASMVITGRVAAGTAGQTITNTVTRTQMDRPDTVATNDYASAVLTVKSVDLGVTKRVNDAEPPVGATIWYTITISNFGPDIATGVVVTDTVPAGVTYSSYGASKGSYVSGSGTWTVGTLTNGYGASLVITGVVDAGTAGFLITNIASLRSVDQTDTNPANNSASATILVESSDLGVVKDVNNPSPNEGDSVTYTIVITNNGPTAATGVEVTDRLTNGITYVGHIAGQGSYDSGSGLWTVGGLAVGGYATLEITASVNAGTLGKSVTNRSVITRSDQPDSDAANNQDTAIISVSGLYVTKASDVVGFAIPGSNITYTITVSNADVVAHQNVTVVDYVPTGTYYVVGSTNVTLSPPAGTSTNGVLDQFSVQSYANNNGTVNWMGNWVETGDDGNPATGNAYITAGGALRIRNGVSLTRSVDLTNILDAVLYFNFWETDAVDTNNVRDNFGTVSYFNNDGSNSWQGGWQEGGESDGATNGGARVAGGYAELTTNRTLARGVDISGATNATMSFVYRQRMLVETNNVRDNFGAISFANSDGTVAWNGNWIEIGEADGANNGDVVVANDTANYQLRLRDNDNNGEGVRRGVNLLGYTNAVLTFDYRRLALSAADRYVAVSVSSNNGASWTEIVRFQGPVAADGVYNTGWSSNITRFAATNTQIRFMTATNNGNNEGVWFDNIDVAFTRPMQETNDVFSVYASSDGAAWTQILSVTGNIAGTVTNSFDISSYIGTNTSVRFAVTNYESPVEVLMLDNPDITWMKPNLETNDFVHVDVSTNGVDWVTLMTMADDFGSSVRSSNYNVSAYAGTNTRIRLRTSGYTNAGEEVFFDNVAVTNVRSSNPGNPGPPPVLGTNYVLNPGGVLTFSFTVTVTNPCSLTQIVNTVSVNSTQHPVPITAQVVDPIINGDLGVVKTVNNSMPYPGSNVTYTIVITNNGPTNATGVQVTEKLTNGLTYVSHTVSQGGYDSGSGVWTVGAMANLASATMTITATVGAGTAGQSITNIVRITAHDQSDDNPVNNQDPEVIVVAAAELGVTKTASSTTPFERENLTYTILLTNNGPSTAHTVVLYDRVPTGLTYQASVPSQGTYDNVSGSWVVGTLANGDYATLQITALVNTNTAGRSITNHVAITNIYETDPYLPNNSNSVVVIPQSPPLDITKISDTTNAVSPGSNITYTIVVSNRSSVVQTGIVVTDSVPPSVSYVPGSCWITGPMVITKTFLDNFGVRSYGNNDGTTNWSGDWGESEGDGALAGNLLVAFDNVRGDTYTFKLSGPNAWLRRQANLGGFTNAVLSFDYRRVSLEAGEFVAIQVSSNGFGGTWTELARFQGVADDVAYTPASYDITSYIATNTSIRFIATSLTHDVSDIVWFDDVLITAKKWGVDTVAGTDPPQVASGYTLYPSNALTISLSVTVSDTPSLFSLTNEASVISALMTQPRFAYATNQVAYTDLGVTKDTTRFMVGTNQLFTYYITLTNNGPQVATGVRLTDDWPAQIVYVGYVASTGTFNSGSMVWSGFNLAVGAGATLNLSGRVDVASDDILITNTIRITKLNQYDTNPANDQDNAVIETLVVLSRVEAFSSGGRTIVEWETDSEINTAGFFLLRRDGRRGFVGVNDRIVPAAPGAPQGGVYRVVDPVARTGKRYSYKLLEIETTGREREYGPFDLVIADSGNNALAKSMDSSGLEYRARVSPAKQARLAAKSVRDKARAKSGKVARPKGLTFEPLKLTVREPGVYCVSASQVALTLGLDTGAVAAEFAAGRVRLSNVGRTVSHAVATGGAGIYFYGEKVDSAFTGDNIYRLTWEAGRLMETAAGILPDRNMASTSFRERIHYDTQRYAALGMVDDPRGDHWLWEFFVGGGGSDGIKTLTLRAESVVPGNVTASLTVRLQGTTAVGRGRDHHAVIKVNGTQVGEMAWAGAVACEQTFEFSQAVLQDGDNAVEITALLDPMVSYSIFYLDSFDLSYVRRNEAVWGQFEFISGGDGTVEVSGFATSDLEVLDVTSPETPFIVNPVDIDRAGSGWVVLFGAGSVRRYAAFAGDSAKTVSAMETDAASDLKAAGNEGVQVIVTVPELKDAAERLAVHRRSLGLTCKVVMLGDIYDEFGYGIVDPWVVREFLKYARENWMEGPRFLLMCGEGTYDYRGYMGVGDNVLPPLLTSTPRGLFETDVPYGDLDGDGIPEIAVGRLPALTAAELDGMVNKIIAYETAAPDAWKSHITLGADAPDKGGDFDGSSDAVDGIVDVAWGRTQVRLSGMNLATGRALLAQDLNNGTAMLNFFGHGGMDSLGMYGLLKTADVAGLANAEKPPILTAMTCVLGRFGIPGYDTLGEALMLKTNGGAVAVWAPAGLSYNTPAEGLAKEFYRAVFDDGQGVLGKGMLLARERYLDTDLTPYMLEIYNLMGDPALLIAGRTGADPYKPDSTDDWKRGYFQSTELGDEGMSGDSADPDSDGLNNLQEYNAGTNPRNSDTDGDSARDGAEIMLGTDPADAGSGHLLPWPSGGADVTNRPVVFAWETTTGATWYRLWLNRNGAKHLDQWISGNAGWAAIAELPAGSYRWWVLPWNGTTVYRWAGPNDFNVPLHRPGQVAVIAPEGTVTTNLPLFQWQADTSASWYQIWVNREDNAYWKKWIQGDTTQLPPSAMPMGSYRWWVRGWSMDGYGNWSVPKAFGYGVTHPVTPVGGVVTGARPGLSWSAVEGAAWYRIWINKDGIAYDQQWVEGNPAWTPSSDMPHGSYVWWVRAWGAGFAGPWSEAASFSIGP